MADEKRLKAAKRAAAAAEEELAEVMANLATVDQLLAEELAKESDARAAKIRAEADKLVKRQRDALTAFGQWFADGYPFWHEYSASVLELDALWRKQPVGVRADAAARVGGFQVSGSVREPARTRHCGDAPRLDI